jgi:4-amino-4-deoxy-L-arabinose transferase-like glycosyltransferase
MVSYLAFFVGLGDTSLWYSQEGRVVRIAQHMFTSGDWITPATQGDTLEGGKPVLYHWLVALLGWMRGFDEVTARAPSAAAALALAIVLYLWLRRVGDDRSGLVGALVFVTSLQVMSLARCAHVDMLFAVWIALSYYLFFLGYHEESHRRRWFLLSYVTLALAVMTKGPVGLALVVVGIGTFLLVRGELRLLGKMELVRGALIFLALAAPWYVAVAIKTHGGFLVQFFVQQNLARFFTTRTGSLHPSKADPWWFYGPQLLLATLPWTPIVLGALVDRASTLWKRHKVTSEEAATALATAWFAAGLFLLSLSKGKRFDYVLPLLPSLALLVGCSWHQAAIEEGKGRGRLGRMVAATQAAVFVVAAGVMLSFTVLSPLSGWWERNVMQPCFSFSDEPSLLPSLLARLRHLVPLGLAATAGLALAGWLWLKPALWPRPPAGPVRQHPGWATLLFTVGLVLACQWFYQWAVLPVLDTRFGLRAVAAEIDHVVPPGQPISAFGDYPHGLLFYLKHQVQLLRPNRTETLVGAAAERTPLYCVLPRKTYLALPVAVREELQPLYESSPTVKQRFVLAANRPARAPSDLTTPANAAVGAGARRSE